MNGEYFDAKLILFGCGKIAEYIAPLLQQMGLSVAKVMDSSAKLWGRQFMSGLKIESYIDVLCEISTNKEDYVVVTAFVDDEAYVKSLYRNGFIACSWKSVIDQFVDSREQDYYAVDEEAGIEKWFMSLHEELLFWESAYAKPGARKNGMYRKLADTRDFIEPYLSKEIYDKDVVMDIGSGILSRYGSSLGSKGGAGLRCCRWILWRIGTIILMNSIWTPIVWHIRRRYSLEFLRDYLVPL